MISKLKDWIHERRIERLRKSFVRHPSLLSWALLSSAINARSKAQIERMERARGIS